MQGWKIRNGFLVLGILLGVVSCASKPSSSNFLRVPSGLMDVKYKLVLIYALADRSAIPLAIVFDPEGGARLSILEIAELKFMAEDLGEMDRQNLVARLDRMEGQRFGGRPFKYLENFSNWSLQPIMRYGVAIGQIMTVDPYLRFEVRTGTSGRVHSILLQPDLAFINEIRDG